MDVWQESGFSSSFRMTHIVASMTHFATYSTLSHGVSLFCIKPTLLVVYNSYLRHRMYLLQSEHLDYQKRLVLSMPSGIICDQGY